MGSHTHWSILISICYCAYTDVVSTISEHVPWFYSHLGQIQVSGSVVMSWFQCWAQQWIRLQIWVRHNFALPFQQAQQLHCLHHGAAFVFFSFLSSQPHIDFDLWLVHMTSVWDLLISFHAIALHWHIQLKIKHNSSTFTYQYLKFTLMNESSIFL